MTQPANSYAKRRDELHTYFDRTAVEGWKKLVSDAPVSRIRETVRAGRDAMRASLVALFPDDLQGWRILDAGCGSGPLAAELARRGADVVGVDLSPEMIRYAQDRWSGEAVSGSLRFVAGDMLGEEHGFFDGVVAMDSLIHYDRADIVAALNRLAARTGRKMAFTIAPATPFLSAMHLVGKAFPRGDRSPAIVPVSPSRVSSGFLQSDIGSDWREGRQSRIAGGFYISHAMEFTKP